MNFSLYLSKEGEIVDPCRSLALIHPDTVSEFVDSVSKSKRLYKPRVIHRLPQISDIEITAVLFPFVNKHKRAAQLMLKYKS